MLTINITIFEATPDDEPEARIVVDDYEGNADAYSFDDLTSVPEEIRRLLAYHMYIEGNVH